MTVTLNVIPYFLLHTLVFTVLLVLFYRWGFRKGEARENMIAYDQGFDDGYSEREQEEDTERLFQEETFRLMQRDGLL
jgi:hypothetical protein